MPTKRQIIEEIDTTQNLKTLAQAYQEISVMRMQKIRNYVLKTRNFLAALSVVYHDVNSSYKHQLEELAKKQKRPQNTFSTIPKNGKEALVLLSANTKLYGDIIKRTFDLFLDTARKSKGNLVIVGKLGRELMDNAVSGKRYEYFEIPDENISFESLKPLMSKLLNYQKTTVFFGQFNNVVVQTPTSLNITGEHNLEQEVSNQEMQRFLFEPSLEQILNFFETQIFTSLLSQTAHESQLARYASRVTAMEEALQNIEDVMQKQFRQKRRIQSSLADRKQSETISGISLWGI